MTTETYEAVIFDLDGTLIDSLQDMTDSCNYVLNAYNLPQHTADTIRTFVGNGAKKLVERMLPEDKRQDEEFVKRISELIPMGRMSRPDEYPATVLYMLSEASSYMTGATVILDGGRTIW